MPIIFQTKPKSILNRFECKEKVNKKRFCIATSLLTFFHGSCPQHRLSNKKTKEAQETSRSLQSNAVAARASEIEEARALKAARKGKARAKRSSDQNDA